MSFIKTKRLKPDAAGIAQAAQMLRAGELVAFPTETVYGLGADATDGQAVARIYEAKGRPSFNPLIAHVPDLDTAKMLAVFNEAALTLSKALWPGPLTLVLPKQPNCPVSELATAGLDTIAIRCPAHPLAQSLLKAAERPIAAPSANPSGTVSPTTAPHVLDGLTGRIEAVLDGGVCTVGLESTILSVSDQITLLRPGGLELEQIEQETGLSVTQTAQTSTISAPGQLASHYAPSAHLTLNQSTCPRDALWLGFGPMPPATTGLTLSRSSNLREAAANLFATLRRLDEICQETGTTQIAAAPIPQTGLGLAINDRLTRAAAPRP